MEPIFKTSLLGTSVSVFPDRIVYRQMWGLSGDQIILAKQIASVEMGMLGIQQLTLETSGGKKYKLLVRLKDKKALREAILGII